MLKDILKENLDVVFCGTAKGKASASKGYYYAGSGNKFYAILYDAGFTPKRLQPQDCYSICDYSIGLTDLVHTESGNDNQINKESYEVELFISKMLALKPKYIAFTSKTAASFALGFQGVTSLINYGLQTNLIGSSKVYILPSTSGSARKFWNEVYWKELKSLTKGHSKIPIFCSEKKMQNWLSNQFSNNKSISDLICNDDEFKSFKPKTLSEKKVHETFLHARKSLDVHYTICEDENISLKKGNILRPDFLLYASETESMIVVELKNDSGASREAGTEVSAYAGEIKSYIPFIAEGDIITVIISPVWSTLLRHFVFHEIFWLQRNIICLEPVEINDNIELRILNVFEILEDNISLKLSCNHLGGYQLCLYDDNLYKEHDNRTRLDKYLSEMQTALSAMSIKGNAQNCHGFAFLWKENSKISIAPYSITIINIAPFQTIERLLHGDEEINDISDRLISNIIQEHNPEGQSESLNVIAESGIRFLKRFCTPRPEGFRTWDYLKESMLSTGTLIAFQCWGVFSDLYYDKLLDRYESDEVGLTSYNPQIGLELLEELIDPNYEFYDLQYYNDNLDEEDGDLPF